MLAANFFVKLLAWFFISALDWVAYMMLSISYTIFYAVSQLDIFGTKGGTNIYSGISSRLYSAISIVMIFVFAYFLIMMIIDPDGGQKKASSQMVKDVVLSIVLVIVLPTLFGYMSLFQKHVLTNNTIGAIILGGSGTIDKDPGKQISMIVFTAFFHPQGTMYSDYFKNDGTLKDHDTAMSTCKSGGGAEEGATSTDEEVCEAWVSGLEEWYNSKSWGIGSISGKAKLRDTVGDEGGMEYIWILSTVAGIAVAYFFFSYTLDVGTRAVKLGFLQLIAPIPVMLKMFPQTKKTFDTWFQEIKKSYLEIFFRLAIIFFIVELCTMVPDFIGTIFDSNNGVEGNFLIKAIATVCLILGLLKFAKEAPGLLKTIFSSSTGLLAGLDWKPGVKRRISENEYAMKGMSAVGGAVGGAVGSFRMARRNYLKNSDVQGDDPWASAAAIGHGLGAGIRGVVSGAKTGVKNTPQEFNAKNMAGTFNSGATGGQAAYVKHENSKWVNFTKAKKDAQNNGTNVGSEVISQWWNNGPSNIAENIVDNVKAENALLTGQSVNSSAATATIDKATKYISDMLGWTKSDTEAIKNAKSELEKKVLSEGRTVRGDQVITQNGGEDVGYDEAAYLAACQSRGVSATYDMAAYERECKRLNNGKDVKNAAGWYYNPATKAYDQNFKPSDYINSRASERYNVSKGDYESSYNPEEHFRKHAISLADAKKMFTNMENEEIRKAFNDKYKDGRATMAATLREQLSKEIGNIGSEALGELNKSIAQKTGGRSTTVDDFLKHLSDKNATLELGDIEALKTVKSRLEQQGKNLSIQAQIQQQARQNGAGANKGGDKPKS